MILTELPTPLECRNNIAPTYSTAPADVWSLGIVLLNMYVASVHTRTRPCGQALLAYHGTSVHLSIQAVPPQPLG